MSKRDEAFEKFRDAALMKRMDQIVGMIDGEEEDTRAPDDMSLETPEGVEEYDDRLLIRDGALALRADEKAYKDWLNEERRVTLEMTAVSLFENCENLSQRAMRVRAALRDCPPEGEEDYLDEDDDEE